MFCTSCGKPLEEGQICQCQQETHTPPPQFEWQPKKKKPAVLGRFWSVVVHYVTQPMQAIKQAGEFGDAGVGMLCCLLQALLLARGIVIYLVKRVTNGYQLGFYEQQIPFLDYLNHSGYHLVSLLLQLFLLFVAADVLILFFVLLFSGKIGRFSNIVKGIGGIGTALLMSGIYGFLLALIVSFFPQISSVLLVGWIAVSLFSLWVGVQESVSLSSSRLLYLFPIALMVSAFAMNVLISSNPVFTWIAELLL